MTRTIKRLNETEFNSLGRSLFGSSLSGEEQRKFYLMAFNRAVQCLYSELHQLEIGITIRNGAYILAGSETVRTEVWNTDNQEWRMLLDFNHLNWAWDAGITLLKSTDKRLPFNQGSEDTFIKMHDQNKIFPVN